MRSPPSSVKAEVVFRLISLREAGTEAGLWSKQRDVLRTSEKWGYLRLWVDCGSPPQGGVCLWELHLCSDLAGLELCGNRSSLVGSGGSCKYHLSVHPESVRSRGNPPPPPTAEEATSRLLANFICKQNKINRRFISPICRNSLIQIFLICTRIPSELSGEEVEASYWLSH